jgi:tape measure domain-containing protein
MALNLGVISAEIRLEFGRFVDGVRTARSAMQNAFGSSTQSSINNTTRTVDNLGTHLKSIERIVGGILVSQGFYRMFNDIQKANGAMLDFMNNIQKSQIAMQYFLGNAKDANAFIMNMEDFAAKTSFSTEQAMTLSRRLMAAQFDPAKVKSVMEVLNDSASATGATAEQMDRIVLALTQMRTNGKIAGQEMRQLAEAGIPIYQILNEELGVTKKQLMNIGKLHIDGDIGVQAVLNGLEKRYKGAAIAIANTLPGMWETITDDMKMIGNDIFMYPYKAFEGGMRKIRDAMEKARYNVFMTGAGGLFENMFSPKTQANLRTILASIRSLVQSVSYLASALKPVVGIIGTAFTEVISKAILPLAALARVVVIVAVVALKVITPLRYLLASIGGFIIATVAAKALMILWRVTGLGMIASVVASAVRALTTAIKWLIFAIVDNPIILFFIALAGVAGYFASKLDIVHKALGSVKNGLTSLIGVDPTKIFTPKIKEANDSTDKFNDSVVTTDDNLKKVGASLDNTGKNAAKAGKKVKDSFIQSFDEVFTIPDKVDKVADTLNGVGSIPFDDNLNIPDLGKGGPGGSGIKLPKLDLPNLFPSADDLWAGLGKSLKGMWKSAVKWFKSINSYDIFGWAFTFGSWIDKYLVQPISKWAKDSTDAIAGWVHDAGVSF